MKYRNASREKPDTPAPPIRHATARTPPAPRLNTDQKKI